MARSENIYGSNPTGAAERIANKALTKPAKDDVWGPVDQGKAVGQSNNPSKDRKPVREGVPKQNSADKRFTKGN